MNVIFSKYFIVISLVSSLGFISCKKNKEEDNTCCCPEQATAATPPQRLIDIKANGFFVMKKYYTITGSSVTYDSCFNYAEQLNRLFGQIQHRYIDYAPYSIDGLMFDSIKVNNVKYQKRPYDYFKDSTNTQFNSPFKFEFYGDTAMFDVINYIDNDLLIPDYTGYLSLPDSVSYNKGDLIVNIGTRLNTKETEVFLYTDRFANLGWHYIENDQNSFTVLYNDLPYDWHTDKLKYRIYLRNWVSKTINGRNYYFVCENIYFRN